MAAQKNCLMESEVALRNLRKKVVDVVHELCVKFGEQTGMQAQYLEVQHESENSLEIKQRDKVSLNGFRSY